MNVYDVFTAESIEEFRRRTAEASTRGRQLPAKYRQDREDQLRAAPGLSTWIDALEDGDLASATDGALWTWLAAQGFIELPQQRTPYRHSGTFLVRIISPKVFDGFRTASGPRTDFAFTTVKVCLRREPVPPTVAVPEGWHDTFLIDTELFELPPDVSEDMFDDREKIHLIYLAGVKDGQFVYQPVYIGIGTGEAYGTGPRRRTGRGRFRFYRYDVKDNFQLEYVRLTEGRRYERENVTSVPDVPAIGDTRATLVLARSEADTSFMSISDPNVAECHTAWLKAHPQNRIVFREITLEKVHDDLRTGRPSTPFRPDDVPDVLLHAWQVQRWYHVAWQHPRRLTATEGIDLYYDELPAFRREEYQIYRFKPEIVGLTADDPQAPHLTVPRVLRSEELRSRLEAGRPEEATQIKEWLQNGVVKDLYAYGSHPELRLCTAIALWQRLSTSGLWDEAVQAAYSGTLYGVDLSAGRMCSGRGAGSNS